MKVCNNCKIEKDESEYYKRKGTKDGLQYICIPCKKDIDKKQYEKNSESKKEANAVLRDIRRKMVRDQFWLMLSRTHCVDCDMVDPRVMTYDFHDCSFNLSDLISGSYSWETVTKKIEPYDPVCANCLLKRASQKHGWWRAKKIFVSL